MRDIFLESIREYSNSLNATSGEVRYAVGLHRMMSNRVPVLHMDGQSQGLHSIKATN